MKISPPALGLILLAQSAAATERIPPETRLRRKIKNDKKDVVDSAAAAAAAEIAVVPYVDSTKVACHILKKGTWKNQDGTLDAGGYNFWTMTGDAEADVALPAGSSSSMTSVDTACKAICADPHLRDTAFKHRSDQGHKKDCAPVCEFADATLNTGFVKYECLTQEEKKLAAATTTTTTTVHPPPAEIHQGVIIHHDQWDEEKEKEKSKDEGVEEEEEEEEGYAPEKEDEEVFTMCHVRTLPNGQRKFKTVTGTQSELEEKDLWKHSFGRSCEYCCFEDEGMLTDLCPGYVFQDESCRPRCDKDDDEGDDDAGAMKCAYDVMCPEVGGEGGGGGEELSNQVIMGAPGANQVETADGDGGAILITKEVCFRDLNRDFFYSVYVDVNAPVDESCFAIAGAYCVVDGKCEGYCDDKEPSLTDALNLKVCTNGNGVPAECRNTKEFTAEGSKVFECNYDRP